MRWTDLSATEQAIFSELARGLRNTEIAQETGIPLNTVRNTISRVYYKLGLKNRTEALLFVLRENDELAAELIEGKI